MEYSLVIELNLAARIGEVITNTPLETDVSAQMLVDDLRDARERTLALVRGIRPDQLMGPRLDIVNPLPWEIGHVAWFSEFWILRHLDGCDPINADGDALYNSAEIAHDARWQVSLLSLDRTLDYMQRVLDACARRLESKGPSSDDAYFYRLATYHEDMHAEALLYTRQTLSYPRPEFCAGDGAGDAGPLPGDVEVEGGSLELGASGEEPFVFDNEKWGHTVELAPFRIARAPVTNQEYGAFVADGGYRREDLWGADGWCWRTKQQREHPVGWSGNPTDGWQLIRFDERLPLPPHQPVMHLSWFEAEAYCRWAGRRLPSEAEWEAAAALGAGGKRRFPWGDESPTPEFANLDGRIPGCADVAAFPQGDSAVGCRQMLGNVWEWTASNFGPYPGFEIDPYKEYSEPWFGTRKVLRGGSWATRGRLLRNTWRNFFTPDRNDIFVGFRTCAV